MAEELKIKVTVDNKGADSNLNSLDSVLNKTESSVKDVSQSTKGLEINLGKLAKSAGIAAVSYIGFQKAVQGVQSVISKTAEFEKLQTRLVNLYQDADKAGEVFQKFKKIAATTPFSLTGVVEAGAQLKAFGLDSENTLKSVTDLAAYMGLDVVEAASAVGRAFAGGAGAADILRERGVLQLISSFKGIDDLTQLTLPEFRKAMLETFVDPAAGIAGATDLLSNTYVGALANMGDAWDNLRNTLGTAIVPVINTSLIDIAENSVRSITDAMNTFAETISGGRFEDIGKIGENLAGVSTESVKAASQFGYLSSVLITLTKQTELNTFEQQQRKKIIDQLNKDYPQYLNNVIQESDNYIDLSDNLSTAKKRLEEYYKVKTQQAIVEDLETQLQKLSELNSLYEYAYNQQKAFESGQVSAAGAVVRRADGAIMSQIELGREIEKNSERIEILRNALQRQQGAISETGIDLVINIDARKLDNIKERIDALIPEEIQSDVSLNLNPQPVTLEIDDENLRVDLNQIASEIDSSATFNIVADFESTIAELDRFAAVGIDVTDKVKEAFTNLYAELEALGMQDSETYQYFVAMKKQADDAYFEQKRAQTAEDMALGLSYYDTLTNAATSAAEQMMQGEVNWANVRKQVLSGALSSTIKYFADLLKQEIIAAATRKTIAKAAEAASVASANITGSLIASAYAPAAAFVEIATLGGASVAAAAGLTGTVAMAQGLAAAADGAYIDSSGKIHGAGTGTSDSILAMTEQGQPIMVSNGEMIIKEKAVKEYYHDLQAINHDQKPSFSNVTNNKIQKFVNGGAISKVSNVASTVNNAKNLTALIDNNFDSFTDNISNSKENFTENIKNSSSDINSNKLVKIQEESQNSIFNNIQMTPANNSPSDTIINMIGAATGAYVDSSGEIHGAGTGTSDSIMAITEQGETILVSNGEMIIKEKAVKEYFPVLNAINNDSIPKFAGGGVVGYVNNPVEAPEFKNIIGLDELRKLAGRTENPVFDIILKNWSDESTQRVLNTYSDRGEVANLANMAIREKRLEQYNMDVSGIESRLDRAIGSIDRLGNRLTKNRVNSPARVTTNSQLGVINQDRARNAMIDNGYDQWSF